MPMCKISGCREPAQRYGKRLCPEHEARRQARNKIYFALPKCEFCGTQHTNNKNDQGVPECPTCRNKRYEREFEQDRKNWIVRELMSCSDIEELKNFILVHILKD